MRILVIGSGFIARPIIKKLELEGHSLLVYSRSLKDDIRCEQIKGDIFCFDDFIKVFSWKPQIIVQAAWITSHMSYTNHPLNYEFAKFTQALVREVLNTDLEHLIILGSCAEYGLQIAPSVAGKTQLNPNNIYAEQKVVAFNSCVESLSGSDIRLTWARIFQPYGVGQDENRLIPYLINSIKANKAITLRDTTTLHDWITTQDIASAISWIVSNALPREVDIGTSVGYSNIEVTEKLQHLIGGEVLFSSATSLPPSKHSMAVVGEESPLFSSGWQPAFSLEAGLEWLLE
jgi:nucleoside-diphosphate-sugar epimerase